MAVTLTLKQGYEKVLGFYTDAFSSGGQLKLNMWCRSARVSDLPWLQSGWICRCGWLEVEKTWGVCSRFRTAGCSTGWPWACGAAPPHDEPHPWCPRDQNPHPDPTCHHPWQDSSGVYIFYSVKCQNICMDGSHRLVVQSGPQVYIRFVKIKSILSNFWIFSCLQGFTVSAHVQ